jgi:hypothetical protein
MTDQAHRTVGFTIYGVTLNLSCDSAELVDYLCRLLPRFVAPTSDAPDLEVNARWVPAPWERGVSLFGVETARNGVGKRMEMAQNDLVWFNTHRDKDLQLRFRRGRTGPVFDVAYCFQPSRKKLAKYPNLKFKKFFDLLRYLVLFPVAWHLERTRGWYLVHAAAVAAGDRAILIGGPGGAGKTTTSLALVARAGMHLLTENLLFTDGAHVFPLIEPLRLTEESLALLGDDLRALEPVELPGGLSKLMFWPAEVPAARPARPALFFLPEFSAHGFARRIAPEIACEQIAAVNRLTLELNDYYWYTAPLDFLWPQPGNAQRQLDVVARFSTTAACYALGIDRSAGVAPVVDRIVHCLGEPAGAVLEST